MESTRIRPDDPRYGAVVEKRFNKRFSATPDYVRLVGSTEQVVSRCRSSRRGGAQRQVAGRPRVVGLAGLRPIRDPLGSLNRTSP
jgi:hypothetical protein